MIIPDLNLVATLPLLFLSAWACVLLLISLWLPKHRTHVSGWIACLGMLATIVLVVFSPEGPQEAFGGMAGCARITEDSTIIHTIPDLPEVYIKNEFR